MKVRKKKRHRAILVVPLDTKVQLILTFTPHMDPTDQLEVLQETVENITYGSEVEHSGYKFLDKDLLEIQVDKDLIRHRLIFIQFIDRNGKEIFTTQGLDMPKLKQDLADIVKQMKLEPQPVIPLDGYKDLKVGRLKHSFLSESRAEYDPEVPPPRYMT